MNRPRRRQQQLAAEHAKILAVDVIVLLAVQSVHNLRRVFVDMSRKRAYGTEQLYIIYLKVKSRVNIYKID